MTETSPPSWTAADDQAAYVRALCTHHASALLAVASELLDDAAAADEIVAATLAAACRTEQRLPLFNRETRTRLARSVYHRCLGRLAYLERFPQLSGSPHRRAGGSPLFGDLPAPRRALAALALFGQHDTTQLARTVGLPEPVVLGHIAHVLRGVAVLPAWPGSDR